MRMTSKTMMTTARVKLESENDHIPIITDEVARVLTELIQTKKMKYVLEIGTAYSYSAHVMADAGATIYTAERQPTRLNKAKSFLEHSVHKSRIHLIPHDIKEYNFENKTFDLIFLDGAKSQYQQMFEQLHPYLNPNGLIVCDNMFFHDYKIEDAGRQAKKLLTKLEKFKAFLNNHDVFESVMISIGDGLSVSWKKEDVDYQAMKTLITSIASRYHT